MVRVTNVRVSACQQWLAVTGVVAAFSTRRSPDALIDAPLGYLVGSGKTQVSKWSDNSVSLAQLTYPAVRDDRFSGPWQRRPGGPVLVGALNVHDAQEVAAALGLDFQSVPHLLLSAYDRWGPDLLRRLDGDFSFVIWDAEHRRLFAARDRFGVKPMAFRETNDGVVFASEAAALDDPQTSPDEIWIREFLEGEGHTPGRMPFRNVKTVLPGHRVICENGNLRQEPWWKIEPKAIAEAEIAEALREALMRAVARRMTRTSATLLSGGLDSSSITCLAARHSDQALRCVSIRHPDRAELDEGEFIDAVRAKGNLWGMDEPFQPGSGFENVDDFVMEQGAPIYAPNYAMLFAAYSAASKAGANVVLDGHGGDEVIGSGEWVFSELLHRRRWRTFGKHSLTHLKAGQPIGRIAQHVFHAFATSGPSGIRRVAQKLVPAPANMRLPTLAHPSEGLHAMHETDELSAEAFAHDHLDPYTRFHARLLLNPQTVQAFEFLEIASRNRGVEARFPFYDAEVIAITLGQSTEAKIADGQPRALLRKAMKGIIPEVVRQRNDKQDFTSGVMESLERNQLSRIKRLATDMPDHLEPYIDKTSLEHSIAGLEGSQTRIAAHANLIRVTLLESWLRLRVVNPSKMRAASR